MSEDSQYLTQKQFKEGLAEFTEEVLLPAVERIIDVKLEEKLESILDKIFDKKFAPITQSLNSIEEKIVAINKKLDKIEKVFDREYSFCIQKT